MRTSQQWLGFARRWTPTASQRDVEDPATVLIVGHDEPDFLALNVGGMALVVAAGFFGRILFMPGPDPCWVESWEAFGYGANAVFVRVRDAPVLTGFSRFARPEPFRAIGSFDAVAPPDIVEGWGLIGPSPQQFQRPGMLIESGDCLEFGCDGAGVDFSVSLAVRKAGPP